MCRTSELDHLIRRMMACGFSARHMGFPKPTGPWGAKLDEVWSRMAVGTIVALIGPNGRGKTQMAANLGARVLLTGGTVRYTKALSFFIEIRATYSGSTPSDKEVLDSYITPHVLVIDEIHQRGETDWESRVLTHLIDRRYDAQRDTILIGNQSKQDSLDALGESIESRIVECGGIVTCDWQNFRKAT